MKIDGCTWLVVNGASGSNGAESVAAIEQALAAAGHRPARVIDLQAAMPPTRAELEAAGAGLLVIFTGDGSVNAVVNGLEGWAGQVLVLPGGTANLLSHALHGESGPEAIVAALGTGRLVSVRRNGVRCSRGTALCEVLAGPGATWSDVREEIREGDIADIAGAALEAARQSTSGPMVQVMEPALGREEGYSGVRLTPHSAGMEASGYGVQGLGDFVRQGVALLRRDFREGPHDELGRHGKVTCLSTDGSPIELMIDGERVTGGGQEVFSLAPLAVNLLAVADG